MADEIDAGKIVAEIVLETQQARENAEEIKESLDEIASKKVSPKIDNSVYEEIARLSQKAAAEWRSKFSSAVDDIDKKVVVPTIKPELDKSSLSGIEESYKELEKIIEQNKPPTIKLDFDKESISLVKESYEDTVDEICRILEKLGIKGEKANKIIEACFQDVDSLKKYQNNLQILANKLEVAQKRYQELEQAKLSAEKQNNVSEVNKLTTAIEKQAITIKSLEAKFDNTYSQMDSAVEKAVTNYQKQEASAEKAIEKQVQFNQALANKQAGKDFVGSVNLATTSLRTFNSIAPDAVDGIGEIITQINTAKTAMTAGVSAPLAVITALVAGIGVVANLIVSAAEKRKEAEDEARQAAVESAESSQKERSEVENLAESYVSLASKVDAGNITYSESLELKKQLADLQDELVEKYGDEAESIDLVNGNIEENIQLLRDKAVAEAESYVVQNESSYQTAKSNLAKINYYQIEDTGGYGSESANIQEKVLEFTKNYFETRNKEIRAEIEKGNTELQEIIFDPENSTASNLEIQVSTGQVQDELTKYVTALKKLESENADCVGKFDDTYTAISNIMQQINQSEIDGYNKTISEYQKNQDIINNEGSNLFSDLEEMAYTKEINEYTSALSNLSSAYQTVAEGGELNLSTLKNLCETYPALAEYFNETGDATFKNGELIKNTYAEQSDALKKTAQEEISYSIYAYRLGKGPCRNGLYRRK